MVNIPLSGTAGEPDRCDDRICRWQL